MKPGVIGIIAQDLARYTIFSASVTGLKTPPDSQTMWQYGHAIPANMTALVQRFLDLPAEEADWLWILGDDHSFSPDLLMKLLEAETPVGVPDIIVPVCLSRFPPHDPVVYSACVDGRWIPYDFDSLTSDAPFEIHSAGSAGMLVRRHVFEALPAPWFAAYQFDGTQMNEDFFFCHSAREAGATIWCRPDAALGHCVTGAIWPVRERDGLHIGLSLMTGAKMILPK